MRTIGHAFRFLYLGFANWLLTSLYKFVRLSPSLWRFGARHYSEWMGSLGRVHAYLACAWSTYTVPAYKDYLQKSSYRWKFFALNSFPETSKEIYIKKYSPAQRCRYGRLSHKGTHVDESAGSSGTPYNWMRSEGELAQIHKNMAGYLSLILPAENRFTINGFSMGAWATGTITGEAAARVGMVKNTGPDIDKIFDTIMHFGNDFNYLITAYPPFLKQMIDEFSNRGFDFSQYSIDAMVGGEGITEALRSYCEKSINRVRSVYGATDLTLGISGESTFTIWLRNTLMNNPEIREQVLGENESRIPMIFQYNPLENYLEVNENRELVCTVNSSHVLTPKLRYNLGDEVALYTLRDVTRILKVFPDEYNQAMMLMKTEPLRLPLMLFYGRKDSTISYMGANIYPQDVEYGLYADSSIGKQVSRFCLQLKEKENLEPEPVLHIELINGLVLDVQESEVLASQIAKAILQHLASINRDIAEAIEEDAHGFELNVQVHAFESDVFGTMQTGLKNKYLVS
ncbi:MAG TPA: phenylacetate--CoA ligase family protein [Acidimicrobiia bacterium]|nr:phenylacetate--CoA ligase family protein [Acidimicrobiia bacterium]